MKVDIITRTEACVEDYDYCDAVEIYLDGVKKFGVHDGEPEGNNLGRNFSDVYNVGDLLEYFYNLGKSGLDVEFNQTQSDEI